MLPTSATVLVSTVSNSHVFLLTKCEWLLQMQKLLTFFFQQKKILEYNAIFNDHMFNDALTTTSLVLNKWAQITYYLRLI